MSEAEPTPAPKPESSPADVKPKKAPRARKPREPKPPPRLKIVWTIGEPGGATLKTFPYAERAAADAAAASHPKLCIVKALKVPFAD
jgi:hypothetical protein